MIQKNTQYCESAGIPSGNSRMRVARDMLNGRPSHAVPTVANGMVYIGNNDCLAAYGE